MSRERVGESEHVERVDRRGVVERRARFHRAEALEHEEQEARTVELVVARLLRRDGEPADAPAPRQPASLRDAREHEGAVDARDAAAVAVATIARGRRRRVDAVEARSAPHHTARLAAVHAQRLGSRDIALRREHVRQLRDARTHGAFRLVAHLSPFFFFFAPSFRPFFFVRSKLWAFFYVPF